MEERTGSTALWQIKSYLLEKKEVELVEGVLKENKTQVGKIVKAKLAKG